MPALRILAGLAAVGLFVMAVRGYERRRISRLNMIILFVLCAAVVALAIYPPLFDPVMRTFDFQRGTNGVIFALLVAVGILFFLYLRAQTTADTNERSIRLLVEAMGQERFDWDRARGLPDGPRLVTISPAFTDRCTSCSTGCPEKSTPTFSRRISTSLMRPPGSWRRGRRLRRSGPRR